MNFLVIYVVGLKFRHPKFHRSSCIELPTYTINDSDRTINRVWKICNKKVGWGFATCSVRVPDMQTLLACNQNAGLELMQIHQYKLRIFLTTSIYNFGTSNFDFATRYCGVKMILLCFRFYQITTRVTLIALHIRGRIYNQFEGTYDKKVY